MSNQSRRIERETLLMSMDWPDEPCEICLQCGIKQRNAFSWFCCIECEDKYVELNVKHRP
jgi:hypothetical protein